jgi:hypothetical protein
VLAHDALGSTPTPLGEHDPAAAGFEVALRLQAVDGLRDGLGTMAEALHEARLNDHDALFLESVNGLEVLLDGRMEAIRHFGRAYRSPAA